MDAGKPFARFGFFIAAVITACCCLSGSSADAANFRTRNFIIQAPTPDLARAVGEAAERFRHDLAVYWLGRELPAWPTPCPVHVVSGPNLAAQGVTTYNRAPVRDFQMEVIGTPERILDSVLPHEVSHTVLATHFGRPLPRWADEGICTTVEHEAERKKHEIKLREFLASRRGLAMNRMFLLTEYPNDVLPLYAQGYSVCRFFIEQKGPEAFIQFLEGYMRHPSWTDNVREHYGYESLAELQEYWLAWVADGSGPVNRFVKGTATPDVATIAAAPVQPGSARANPSVASPTPRRLNATVNAGSNAPINALARNTRSTGSTLEPDDSGWYLRRKLSGDSSDARVAIVSPQTPSGELLATPVPERTGEIPNRFVPIPPSIRQSGPYSAAQPQPEQSFSGQSVYNGQAGVNGTRPPLRTSSNQPLDQIYR